MSGGPYSVRISNKKEVFGKGGQDDDYVLSKPGNGIV
jgi:hypothetical protein